MICKCGKKCTLFCMCISIWGMLQLLIMGLCYTFNSLSLLSSLPLHESFNSLESFRSAADGAYRELALRCYVTALIYGVFAFVSYIRLCGNRRREVKRRRFDERRL